MRRTIALLSILAFLVLTGQSCISFGKANTGVMGVFRSTDNGDNWQPAMTFPSVKGVQSIAGLKVYKFFSDPQDVNALYLTTRGQGVYYTYDNAASWRSIPALAGKFIYGFAVDPTDKCTLYAADSLTIYKSDDCARTWRMIYQEQRTTERFVSLAVDYKDTKIIYAAELGGDALISRDAGKSWSVIKRFGFYLQNLLTDPLVPGRVYVAAYRDGLFISDNQGTDWRNAGTGFKEFSGGNEYYRLVLNSGKKDSIFWVSKYGILRSDDAGATWSSLTLITPPGSVNIYSFAIDPKNQKVLYYTGTILGEKNVPVRSTFYKSVDGGQNWVTKKLPSNAIPSQIQIHPVQTNVLLMGFTSLN